MSNYSVSTSVFKGFNVISISDAKTGRVIISFGVNKAKAIVECLDEVKKFAESDSKSNSIDIGSLSKEQLDAILNLVSK